MKGRMRAEVILEEIMSDNFLKLKKDQELHIEVQSSLSIHRGTGSRTPSGYENRQMLKSLIYNSIVFV